MRHESVSEFLARGGRITRCPPGSASGARWSVDWVDLAGCRYDAGYMTPEELVDAPVDVNGRQGTVAASADEGTGEDVAVRTDGSEEGDAVPHIPRDERAARLRVVLRPRYGRRVRAASGEREEGEEQDEGAHGASVERALPTM
jgi:hypothetical protein